MAKTETDKMTEQDFRNYARSCLRPASIGLLLATLTILLGQVLGIVFGLNEGIIKDRLKAEAVSVSEVVYAGDEVAMTPVLEKSWRYMVRAHMHAGALGTTAVALIVVLALLGLPRWQTFTISTTLGLGGLGYSVFWILAGYRAPALGSTGAAKESLRWLAMPSSGGFVLATVAVIVLLSISLIRGGSGADAGHNSQ